MWMGESGNGGLLERGGSRVRGGRGRALRGRGMAVQKQYASGEWAFG